MGYSTEICLVSFFFFCITFLRSKLNVILHISLVTLAVQNASLTIIMHYSRVTTSPSKTYSAAAAVLLNELLKGFISLVIAFSRIDDHGPHHSPHRTHSSHWMHPGFFVLRCKKLGREVFSPDCWKLSIPAILYGELGLLHIPVIAQLLIQ